MSSGHLTVEKQAMTVEVSGWHLYQGGASLSLSPTSDQPAPPEVSARGSGGPLARRLSDGRTRTPLAHPSHGPSRHLPQKTVENRSPRNREGSLDIRQGSSGEQAKGRLEKCSKRSYEPQPPTGVRTSAVLDAALRWRSRSNCQLPPPPGSLAGARRPARDGAGRTEGAACPRSRRRPHFLISPGQGLPQRVPHDRSIQLFDARSMVWEGRGESASTRADRGEIAFHTQGVDDPAITNEPGRAHVASWGGFLFCTLGGQPSHHEWIRVGSRSHWGVTLFRCSGWTIQPSQMDWVNTMLPLLWPPPFLMGVCKVMGAV